MKRQNEVKSIVIGTHASALPKKLLKKNHILMFVKVKGQLTVIELINFLKNNNKDLKKIPRTLVF